ncbi:hypothetical protein V1517DRAFT_5659 [Lipomyces orientalis]|uniref:Uncharacterized protein n=1 Tax=Lipomyces orientalis TaxID=1233043 RepID=A0ACC3TV42_9ASCO
MNIDQILNSSTLSAQSEDNDSGQTVAAAPDNASVVTKSSPANSPRSLSQQAPQKELSPTSQPRYVNSKSQEESRLEPPNLPQSQPSQTPSGAALLPLQPLPPPQHNPPPEFPTAQQTYAYQQQYQQHPYLQYSPQSYYQPQRTGYQTSTAHHIQPFQHHQYQPTAAWSEPTTAAVSSASQPPGYAVPQQGYSLSPPQGYDRNYGEFSSSMRPWTPPREPRSSQSIQHSVSQENLAPPLEPGDGRSAYVYEGTGLRRVASDGDPQEESSTLAVRPKRRKAPNSTWTLEEDRKLVCLSTLY